MNKKVYISVFSTLVFVLLVSLLVTGVILPSNRTYSNSYCINDRITDDMSIWDISQLYRDNVAVAVRVNGVNSEEMVSYSSLGSGVVVASNGYTYVAGGEEGQVNGGCYIATNYHVIDFIYDESYSNVSVNVITEDERQFSCEVLWASQDFDVALLYCEGLSMNYVRMSDRSIEGEDKLDIEEIFTIGTPLSLQYLNRVTFGNVASDNDLTIATTNSYYYYFDSEDGGELKYLTDANLLEEGVEYYPVATLNNVYEDVIDVSLGISPGNSGGGVFDKEGNLIGLATASTSYTSTNGNQMNGVVPIYPIMQVLDRVISNNENSTNFAIYTLDELSIKAIDSNEIAYASYLREEFEEALNAIGQYQYYTFDGENYNATSYSRAFSYKGSGLYVLDNENLYSDLSLLVKDTVINSVSLNGQLSIIENRNDLAYILLKVQEGDSLEINFLSGYVNSSVTIEF